LLYQYWFINKVEQLENQQEQEISQLKAQLYETKNELELVQKQTNDVVGWIKTYYDPHLGRRMQIGSADQTPREMANQA
jgi:hypothetical protein